MKPLAKLRTKSISARRAGDVAADDAVGLAERALDQGDAVHQAALLGDAAAARAVEADGVHLVEVGHRAVLLGDLEDLGDRGDVAVHRVDALEGDDLRPVGGDARRAGGRGPSGRCAARSASRSGRGGCPRSSRRGSARPRGSPRRAAGAPRVRERRPVRDVARGEEQRRLLAVQVGELALEQHVLVGGAGDVAGAAGAGAAARRSRRASRRAPSGAGPCRGSRSSTRR